MSEKADLIGVREVRKLILINTRRCKITANMYES